MGLFGAILVFSLPSGVASSATRSPESVGCPEPDAGFSGRCLDIATEGKSSGRLRLFTQVFGALDKNKKTVLVLQGGPGGLCDAMAKDTRLQAELGESFNLVLFDPRGVGRSKEASQEAHSDMSRYGTSQDLADIGLVQETLAPGQKVALLGHSYGASLALAFAALNPDRVNAVIAVSGGLDSLGFANQPYEKNKALERSLAIFSDAEATTFFEALQKGELSENDRVIEFQEFMLWTLTWLGTFEGQTVRIPERAKRLLASRGRPVKRTDNSTGASRPSDAFAIDPAVNAFIVCHDLVTDRAIEAIQDASARDMARMGRDQVCASSPLRIPERYFDYKDAARKISAPVLLAGGSSDPLMPLSIQRRDYQILKGQGTRVELVELDETGHEAFSECPDKLWPRIRSFLRSALSR